MTSTQLFSSGGVEALTLFTFDPAWVLLRLLVLPFFVFLSICYDGAAFFIL